VPDPAPSGDVLTSAVEKLPPILRASRFGFVVLGILYTAGLIIVNVDLARYGLISVDLARAEYIMAGSLWAFLMIATLAAGDFCIRRAKAWLKRPVKAKDVLFMAVDFLFALFVLIYLVGTLSRDELGGYQLLFGRGGFAYLGILLGAFSLATAISSFSSVLRTEAITLGALFAKSDATRMAPIYSLVFVISMLGTYALGVHPHFAREFGGGKRSALFLVPANGAAALNMLPLPRRNGRIGPVVLLFENESMYMVKPMEEPSKCCTRRAVGIDKKLISALITEPNWSADGKTTETGTAAPPVDEIFL